MPDGHTEGRALTAAQEFDLQLDQQARNFALMLPKHVPLDKFKRVVVTACIQDQKLFTADRRSLFMAAQKCASDGLLPDGREAVLLPFNTKVKARLKDGTYQDVWKELVQYIPMIQGIRTRMRNTGMVASSEAYVVHRNDKFFQKFGSDPEIVHEPPALGTARGDPVGAYAIIRLTSGEVIQEVMDRDEIERVRSFSKAKDGPAWKNHWGEMARKTVLRRAAKSAPTSAEMLTLLDRDDEPVDTGMVDVTGAGYTPEPEPQRQIGGGGEQTVSFLVIDADGEEHEFETADGAVKALVAVFGDARRRGRASQEAAAENNRVVIDALREHDPDLLRDLDPFGLPPLDEARTEQPHSSAGAQTTEGATTSGDPPAGDTADAKGAGSPPASDSAAKDQRQAHSPEHEQSEPPRDLLGDPPAENLTVPLDRSPDIAALEYYGRQMLAMIAERPGDWQRAARIKVTNEGGLAELKGGCPDIYQDVTAALNAARAGA